MQYLLIHGVRIQNKDIRDDPRYSAVYKRTTDMLKEKGNRGDEDPLSNTSADTLTDTELERLFVNLMWCASKWLAPTRCYVGNCQNSLCQTVVQCLLYRYVTCTRLMLGRARSKNTASAARVLSLGAFALGACARSDDLKEMHLTDLMKPVRLEGIGGLDNAPNHSVHGHLLPHFSTRRMTQGRPDRRPGAFHRHKDGAEGRQGEQDRSERVPDVRAA